MVLNLENGDQFMFQSNAGSQRRMFHLIIALDGSCDDHHGILVALDSSKYTRQMCNNVSGARTPGGIKNQCQVYVQYDNYHIRQCEAQRPVMIRPTYPWIACIRTVSTLIN